MPPSNEFTAKNPNKPEEGLEDGTQEGCIEGLTVGRYDGVTDGTGEEDGVKVAAEGPGRVSTTGTATATDRKSTRLNSSHPSISRMPSSA